MIECRFSRWKSLEDKLTKAVTVVEFLKNVDFRVNKLNPIPAGNCWPRWPRRAHNCRFRVVVLPHQFPFRHTLSSFLESDITYRQRTKAKSDFFQMDRKRRIMTVIFSDCIQVKFMGKAVDRNFFCGQQQWCFAVERCT